MNLMPQRFVVKGFFGWGGKSFFCQDRQDFLVCTEIDASSRRCLGSGWNCRLLLLSYLLDLFQWSCYKGFVTGKP
jgi:hypothetical protein